MRTATAAAGSLVFFLIAPATVAGIIPWSLTRWQAAQPLPYGPVVQAAGILLAAIGAIVVLRAFARFVFEGGGTPAPVAPTSRLVVGGLYRHVRNPIYLAVLAVILGQALWLAQRSLVVYAAVVAIFFVTFVRLYEEPTLASRFGAEYEIYRRSVPGWWPRLRPWRPDHRPVDEGGTRGPHRRT